MMKILGYIAIGIIALLIIGNAMKPSKEELIAQGDWLFTTCINEARANDRLDQTQREICGTAAGRIRSGQATLSKAAIDSFEKGLDWDGKPLKE
ncbi:hypothetical protein ACK37C_16450 [Aeromonas veronii]|uniref:hypothetical protein n=1 Tax=Aeromonas veronii TaxID=654 RepID=UPI00191E2396|nr:hypothetical protein [Aeromonas veronii]MBL0631194.1 hypothetical protein [Aeromonas veronii]